MVHNRTAFAPQTVAQPAPARRSTKRSADAVATTAPRRSVRLRTKTIAKPVPHNPTPSLVSAVVRGASGIAYDLASATLAGANAGRGFVQSAATTATASMIDTTKLIASTTAALTKLVANSAMLPFASHPAEGDALRKLLTDLVSASGAPEPERCAAIRGALAKNTDAFLSVLESCDIEALAACADLGEIAKSMGLTRGPALMQCYSLATPCQVKAAAAWTLNKSLELAPDAAIGAIATELNKTIESFDAGKFPLLQKLTDPKEGVDLSDFPKEVGDALPGVLERYFSNLTTEDKRKYVCAFLSLPPSAGEADQIAAVMHECGPGMQKLFQLAASRSKSPVLHQALESLYGNVKPMSFELVQSRLAEELGRDPSEVFDSITPEPLGAATVGQVHAARLKDGREVVIKVLRPGLDDRLRQEFTQMRAAAEGNEYLQGFLLDLQQSGLQELDLRKEARNLAEGERCYNRPELGISAVGLERSVPATPGLLVMERAPGRKFTDMPSDAQLEAAGMSKADCVELKVEVLMKFMEIWYRSLAFDEAAFMHADLHPGNMFFELRPEESPPYKMTIIDFGSAEKLHRTEQNALWKMGAAVAAQHYTGMGTSLAASTFLDAFEDFAGRMTTDQRANMESFVVETLADNPKAEPMELIETILKKTAAFGIHVPLSALQLSRGHKFMEGIGKELNKELDQLDPHGERTRFTPDKVYVGGTIKASIPFGDTVYPALEAVGSGLSTLYQYRDFAYMALLIYAFSQSGDFPGV